MPTTVVSSRRCAARRFARSGIARSVQRPMTPGLVVMHLRLMSLRSRVDAGEAFDASRAVGGRRTCASATAFVPLAPALTTSPMPDVPLAPYHGTRACVCPARNARRRQRRRAAVMAATAIIGDAPTFPMPDVPLAPVRQRADQAIACPRVTAIRCAQAAFASHDSFCPACYTHAHWTHLHHDMCVSRILPTRRSANS